MTVVVFWEDGEIDVQEVTEKGTDAEAELHAVTVLHSNDCANHSGYCAKR